MKTRQHNWLMLMIGGCLLLALVSHCAPVTLGWNPYPTNSPGIVGFNLYAGRESRRYTQSLFVPGGCVTNASIEVQAGAFWFFAVTATNAAGLESDYSLEVGTTVLPEAPTVGGTNIVLLIPQIEASTNRCNWSAIRVQPTVVAATNAAEFFRQTGLKIQGPLKGQ